MRFLSNVSRALIRVMPIARHLKPLRQWSGPYDLSPDGDAMVGGSPDHPELIQVCGFTGHGFMMAPAVGRLTPLSKRISLPFGVRAGACGW